MAAWIYKPKRKYNNDNQLDRKKRQEIYNRQIWRDLRESMKMKHPLCEICEIEGKTTLTEDVHHIVSFTQYVGNERDAIAFDPDNLICVCKQCHNRLHHGNLKGCSTKDEIFERVENLMNENPTNSETETDKSL